MQQKAQAYEQYGEAAVIEMLSSMLPSLVREAAAPMGMIDKVTVISTDGASQLTKNVAGNVAQGLQLANDLLGIDLTTLVSRALSKQSGELSPPAPPAPPPESPPADQSAEQSSGGA